MRSLASERLQLARSRRDLDGQARALARPALETQLAPQLRDALADPDQADPARGARLAHFLRPESNPIVLDRHEHGVGQPLQEHAAGIRLRMLRDVGERLLDDAVDAGFAFGREPLVHAVLEQLDFDAMPAAKSLQVP